MLSREQQPAGGAGRAGGQGSLHLPAHQAQVGLSGGRGPMAAAGERHQQVGGAREPFQSLLGAAGPKLDYHCRCSEQEVPADQADAHGG